MGRNVVHWTMYIHSYSNDDGYYQFHHIFLAVVLHDTRHRMDKCVKYISNIAVSRDIVVTGSLITT
jgi:hypothetical protein